MNVISEPAQAEQLISMFNAGFSFHLIARQLHVQERRVKFTIDTLGLTRKLKRGGVREVKKEVPVKGRYDDIMNEPICPGHSYEWYLKQSGQKKHGEYFSRVKKTT